MSSVILQIPMEFYGVCGLTGADLSPGNTANVNEENKSLTPLHTPRSFSPLLLFCVIPEITLSAAILKGLILKFSHLRENLSYEESLDHACILTDGQSVIRTSSLLPNSGLGFNRCAW